MNLVLHPTTEHWLDVASQPIGGGFVIHGAPGLGRTTMAVELVRRWNCRESDDTRSCVSCRQIAAGTWPDLHILAPADKPSITIEQVRGLVSTLGLAPYSASAVRGVVVDEAQALTVDAQNALLKLIEEPPPATRIVLVTSDLAALLPTVRSRLAPLYVAAPAAGDVNKWLEKANNITPAKAAELAEAADYRPALAMRLADDPAAADQSRQLSAWARDALRLARFDRLVLAKQLADAKGELAEFASRLQRLVIRESAATELARRLEALEQFRRQLTGNVAPRVALERLMLEL